MPNMSGSRASYPVTMLRPNRPPAMWSAVAAKRARWSGCQEPYSTWTVEMVIIRVVTGARATVEMKGSRKFSR
jgi:hypothetical protein